MKELIDIWNYQRISLNIFLILLAGTMSFYIDAIVPLFFLLTTNLYDILGYHFALVRKGNKLPEQEIVKAYRIIQLMFDIILSSLLALQFGLVPAICGLILKLFALQDLLYYFFLKEPLPLTWNWLGFTPLGWFKKNLTLTEVLLQASAGIIISTVLYILYRFS